MSNHFIGVDAGGTATRAILATDEGQVISSGRAAGANSWSSGTSVPEVIIEAVREALDGGDPDAVAGGVIAIAGGAAGSATIAAEIDAGWHDLGLPGVPSIVVDVVAAYAAGSTAPRGMVVAAGTGAIAAVISDGRLERRSGGHGWLVGDEGSAVWLGVEGVRAVLMALDGRGPETALVTPLREALGIDPSDRADLAAGIVTATYSRPPAQLGQLAPTVLQVAAAGDPVASQLVEAAADHLARLALALDDTDAPAVVVLAGSLLVRTDRLRFLVAERLASRWPGAPMTSASSGETGAVALAMGRHFGTPITSDILARLRGG